MRVQPPGAVEDIVQETLVKVIRNLYTCRGEALLFPWMCQICRNEISIWYSRSGHHEAALVSIDDEPGIRAALESFSFELQQDLEHGIGLKKSGASNP